MVSTMMVVMPVRCAMAAIGPAFRPERADHIGNGRPKVAQHIRQHVIARNINRAVANFGGCVPVTEMPDMRRICKASSH